MVKMENTIRILPEHIGEDLDKASERIVQESFEGTIDKKHGMILVAKNVKRVGEGKIIHGDGAIYQNVKFEALTFKPELHEVLDGVVCEVVEFGAFCHIGPLDALIHKSQIMDDHILIDIENKRMEGKQTKKSLKLGDRVRARIVTISLNEMNPRESKIGLTMRQPALGKDDWKEKK
jgi:DNA-directed RNA polymerase subunit E'